MLSFIQTNATPIVGTLTLLSNIIFVAVILAIAFHAQTREKAYEFIEDVCNIVGYASLEDEDE